MRNKNRLIRENIARKSKCDLIAEIIENKNITWKHSFEGEFFIFNISTELRILVNFGNIIIEYCNLRTDLNSENFWDVLEVTLDKVTN